MADIPSELLNTITTGDARVLAERIPDKCARLFFADPPYWIGFDYGHRKDNELEFVEPIWIVGQGQRIADIVCITPGIVNMWNYPRPDWVLGWFKFGGTGRNVFGGFNVWEPILIYGHPESRFWQDAVNVPTYRNHLNINGSYVIDAKHICPKPEPLLTWLVDGLTNTNDVVVDIMCGLGTTPVVAKKLSRQYVAFEIDPDTAERARQRVAQTQPPLFVLQPQQLEMDYA